MNKIQGRYLKKLREEHGYSLRAFAELIYTSKSSLQRWENTCLPDNDDLITRVAELFGMTKEQFIDRSCEDIEDDGLTPDERARAKFGVNGLTSVMKIALFGGIGLILLIPLAFLLLAVFF